MSDCISFCVAPALMVFAMCFGRWGEATPIRQLVWQSPAVLMIACGMLRLARSAAA